MASKHTDYLSRT